MFLDYLKTCTSVKARAVCLRSFTTGGRGLRDTAEPPVLWTFHFLLGMTWKAFYGWIIPPVYGLRLISVESRGIERSRFRAITIWPVVSLLDN